MRRSLGWLSTVMGRPSSFKSSPRAYASPKDFHTEFGFADDAACGHDASPATPHQILRQPVFPVGQELQQRRAFRSRCQQQRGILMSGAAIHEMHEAQQLTDALLVLQSDRFARQPIVDGASFDPQDAGDLLPAETAETAQLQKGLCVRGLGNDLGRVAHQIDANILDGGGGGTGQRQVGQDNGVIEYEAASRVASLIEGKAPRQLRHGGKLSRRLVPQLANPRMAGPVNDRRGKFALAKCSHAAPLYVLMNSSVMAQRKKV